MSIECSHFVVMLVFVCTKHEIFLAMPMGQVLSMEFTICPVANWNVFVFFLMANWRFLSSYGQLEHLVFCPNGRLKVVSFFPPHGQLGDSVRSIDVQVVDWECQLSLIETIVIQNVYKVSSIVI
jgi:hypothetical protein